MVLGRLDRLDRGCRRRGRERPGAQRVRDRVDRFQHHVESRRLGADDGHQDLLVLAERGLELGRLVGQDALLVGSEGGVDAVGDRFQRLVVLFTDADLSAPIKEVERFLAILTKGEADIVIGSRNLALSEVSRPMGREVMSKAFNLLVRLLLLPGIRDTQCGFKCFSRAAAQAIFTRSPASGLTFDVEVLSLARRMGFRIAEVPVRWDYSEGSKVRPLRDAVVMFAAVLRLAFRSLLNK